MKKVLIVGSGISGLSCAIACAKSGMEVILASPFPSERSQSVMAAGGINAVLNGRAGGDSVSAHIEDTLKGGCNIAGKEAVSGLCTAAPQIIRWLEKLGTVFSINPDGSIAQRAFGGQSFNRTCYCGASTGKQIVTALVMEARRYEGAGMIKRRYWMDFYSALIKGGVCYGAVFYNEATADLEMIEADGVVIATGGQNALFGKTTGSTLCDGYAEGKLFMQGVELKNLEFIQYHPTTIETAQKRMLISEAVRGEGGRLFYVDGKNRVYFLEEKFGKKGNLMPRDVVARCIDETQKEVFLDITFLGKEEIIKRLGEVYDLCLKYRGIDISKQCIPVAPSVHFFMGGIAVKNNHETNIKNLYAIGECASIYHGANRLGGNSLLAAVYSGITAAKDISMSAGNGKCEDFGRQLDEERERLRTLRQSKSVFPVMYIRDMLAESMNKNLGISRSERKISQGIEDVTFFLSVADKIHYDNSEMAYLCYSLEGILTLAKATLLCAGERKESRGAHARMDYKEKKDEYAAATIISYDNGAYKIRYDRGDEYEH